MSWKKNNNKAHNGHKDRGHKDAEETTDAKDNDSSPWGLVHAAGISTAGLHSHENSGGSPEMQ